VRFVGGVLDLEVSAVMILPPEGQPMNGVMSEAESQCDEVIIVRGRCRGIQRNEGIKRAKFPNVLMVDADCLLTPDYVEKLKNQMDPKTGAVCGLHTPHPDLSFFSKLEEFSKTGVVLNMGYTGAHGTLYNRKVVMEAGGFNSDPVILADMGERLILNMKRLGYSVKLVQQAKNYHLHRSTPRSLVGTALSCGTTRQAILRLIGRFVVSAVAGAIMLKKVRVATNGTYLLLPFYWSFRSSVFVICGVVRRICGK